MRCSFLSLGSLFLPPLQLPVFSSALASCAQLFPAPLIGVILRQRQENQYVLAPSPRLHHGVIFLVPSNFWVLCKFFLGQGAPLMVREEWHCFQLPSSISQGSWVFGLSFPSHSGTTSPHIHPEHCKATFACDLWPLLFSC